MAALAASAAHVPPIKWAQRKDSLFLTIDVPDMANEKVDLTPAALSFQGETDDTTYAFTFDFHASVVPEESVWKVHGRNVLMHLKKAEVSDEHWPRLTKEKQFDKQYVATDWSRYVDEDDEDDDAGFDVGDLDGAANFGGGGYDGGGYEVDDEPDSDDDVDLTDLDFPPAGGEGVAEEPPQGEDDEATVAPPPVSASDPPVAEEPAATATSTDADETPAPATET